MYRTLLFLGTLWLAPAALAQSTSTDSTLQALLNEVRLLRQQLEAHNAAAQRTQILFFRIQTQQAAVTRASQRADDARGRLADTQDTRRKLEGEAKGTQDSLEHSENPVDRKNMENMLAFFKRRSEELADEGDKLSPAHPRVVLGRLIEDADVVVNRSRLRGEFLPRDGRLS